MHLIDSRQLEFNGILDRRNVMTLESIFISIVYIVVVLPDPVGPVMTIMPCGLSSSALDDLVSRSRLACPDASKVKTLLPFVDHTHHDLSRRPDHRNRAHTKTRAGAVFIDASSCRPEAGGFRWYPCRP